MPSIALETTTAGIGSRSPIAYRIAYAIGTACLRLVFRFEVTGQSNISSGAYIAVANHLNWLDAFALVIALPRAPRPHFIGWDTVTRAPKLWWLIRTSRSGFIPVPRDAGLRTQRRRELHNVLNRCLNAGLPLALFPEGSVGQVEGQISGLRPGFARLALATGTPVIPIALSGTRNLWLRKTVRVVIGAPISPSGVERDELVKRARDAMTRLMPEYVEPTGRRLFERRLTRLIPSLTNWTSSDL